MEKNRNSQSGVGRSHVLVGWGLYFHLARRQRKSRTKKKGRSSQFSPREKFASKSLKPLPSSLRQKDLLGCLLMTDLWKEDPGPGDVTGPQWECEQASKEEIQSSTGCNRETQCSLRTRACPECGYDISFQILSSYCQCTNVGNVCLTSVLSKNGFICLGVEGIKYV